MAKTVGLAFKYARPSKGFPPATEPCSFTCLGGSLPSWGFVVEVEGRVGVESGCEMPGVEDESTAGGA